MSKPHTVTRGSCSPSRIESILIERFGMAKRALDEALSAFYQCPFLKADRL